MFSPKVLDRANVIEFRVEEEMMAAFLRNPAAVNLSALDQRGASFGNAFMVRASADALLSDLGDDAKILQEDLLEIFKKLEAAGAEFGFRTAKEISRFVVLHKEITGVNWSYKDAFDAQLLQKLMPKLHGSSRKLNDVLSELEKFSEVHELSMSLEKINRMKVRLVRDGFTSFAEA
jgi:5-methylcytosine-specific restriction protein B